MNILEVISSLGSKAKDEFQEVVRHFYPHISGYERKCIQRDLEALGHIHTDHMKGSVHVMAPRMCVLPTLEEGVSSVVFTGVRTNERLFIEELKSLPAVDGEKLKVEIEPAVEREGFPSKIILTGQSDGFFNKLQEIANNHGLFRIESKSLEELGQFTCNWHLLGDRTGTPGAWVALHNGISSSSTESLHDRLDHHFHRDDRQTRNHQHLGNSDSWQVFNPKMNNWVFWCEIRNTYDRSLLLIKKERYKYMLAKRSDDNWLLYLDKFSHDPQWAKWAVLQDRDGEDSVLPSIKESNFLIPHGLQLPIELHRVCSLCSGTLPVLDTDRKMTRYSNVPYSIRSHVVRKLSLRSPQNP